MVRQEHKLKTISHYFDAVERGDKTFEVRKDDRGFQKEDVLILQRMAPNPRGFEEVEYDFTTGKVKKELRLRVKYILTGGQFGIEPGYVVMAIEREAENAMAQHSGAGRNGT